MKQCPVCKTTYTDESLRYCLADGAVLTAETEEQTLAKRDAVRVDIPGSASTQPKSKGSEDRRMPAWQKAAIAFVIIGTVFAAVVVLVVGILYMNTSGGGKSQNINSSTPVPSPSPTN